jgi:hypothetical protein
VKKEQDERARLKQDLQLEEHVFTNLSAIKKPQHRVLWALNSRDTRAMRFALAECAGDESARACEQQRMSPFEVDKSRR